MKKSIPRGKFGFIDYNKSTFSINVIILLLNCQVWDNSNEVCKKKKNAKRDRQLCTHQYLETEDWNIKHI